MNSKIDPRGACWQLEASFLRPSGDESHATLPHTMLIYHRDVTVVDDHHLYTGIICTDTNGCDILSSMVAHDVFVRES